MTVTARLEATGLTTLLLDPYSGYAIQNFDPGSPAIREVRYDNPDAHGQTDLTAYISGRAVTMNVKLWPTADRTRDSMRERLRAFMHPGLRPILYVTVDDSPEKRAILRAQSWNMVSDTPGAANVTLQWLAPSGVFESSALHDQVVYAAGSGATSGRTYSLTFNRTYPASLPIGGAVLTNAGNIEAYPIFRIFGPCTDPVFDNQTTSKSLSFSGLTIASGDYVEINTQAHTVYLNGLSTGSLYSKLLFPGTTFWPLAPGANTVRFHPATFTSSVTNVEVFWRDAYL